MTSQRLQEIRRRYAALPRLGVVRQRRAFQTAGTRGRLALTCVTWIAALVVPLAVPSAAWRQIFVLMVIYAALASGLNLLVGFTGLLDLGYVAFYAVGAYTTAILTTHVLVARFGQAFYSQDLWWVPYLAIIPAVVFSGLLAGILGYPTLRARGDYLAIMTLGLGEVVQLVAINWSGLTGGPAGIAAIPPFALGTTKLFNPLAVYYVALVIATPCFIFTWRVSRSHLGRIWRTIREDELVAESMGVRSSRYKLYAYVAGGGIAGAIGVIFAHSQGFVDPQSFTIDVNFLVLSLVIIGGSGTIIGPIFAAIAWVALNQWLSTTQLVQAHPEMGSFILSAVVLVVLIVRPRGLLGSGPSLARSSAGTALRTRSPEEAGFQRVRPTLASGPVRGPRRRPPAGVPGSSKEPPASAGILAGQALRCSFGGVHALNGVDMQVRAGEIVGLIGPNGAGKTTLANVLTGVQRPTSGSLFLDEALVKMSRPSDAARLGISRTFQLIRVLPEMSVLENLLVGSHLDVKRGLGLVLGVRAWSGEKALTERAVAVLELLGLQQRTHQLAAALPYGDRRRVEIGRALMTGPRFLFLDEPAAGMDTRETSELGEIIRHIGAQGIGICLIEHDLGLVTSISDRVIALDRGTVVADGDPKAVATSPAIAHAYLGVEP